MASRALPFVLSLIAGSTDIIGFLGLNGLFTAISPGFWSSWPHIVAGDPTIFSYTIGPGLHGDAISDAPPRWRPRTLGFDARPLLLVQLLFLFAFLSICVVAGPWGDAAGLCDRRRYVRRRSDGGTERARADFANEHAKHCRDDDECHSFHTGPWRGFGCPRSCRVHPGARPRNAHLSGDRRLYDRLLVRRGVGGCCRLVVLGSAHGPWPARFRYGFGDRDPARKTLVICSSAVHHHLRELHPYSRWRGTGNKLLRDSVNLRENMAIKNLVVDVRLLGRALPHRDTSKHRIDNIVFRFLWGAREKVSQHAGMPFLSSRKSSRTRVSILERPKVEAGTGPARSTGGSGATRGALVRTDPPARRMLRERKIGDSLAWDPIGTTEQV